MFTAPNKKLGWSYDESSTLKCNFQSTNSHHAPNVHLRHSPPNSLTDQLTNPFFLLWPMAVCSTTSANKSLLLNTPIHSAFLPSSSFVITSHHIPGSPATLQQHFALLQIRRFGAKHKEPCAVAQQRIRGDGLAELRSHEQLRRGPRRPRPPRLRLRGM